MQNLKPTAGLKRIGVVNHLYNERASGAHFDFTHIEAETQQRFQQRTLAVGLTAQHHNFGDRDLFSECNGGRLQPVVGLKSPFVRIRNLVLVLAFSGS